MRFFSAAQLGVLAKTYCAATGTTAEALGKTIADKNHKLIKRLIAGFGCNSDNADRASAWFTENWPEDVPWPKGVARPAAPSQPTPIEPERATPSEAA